MPGKRDDELARTATAQPSSTVPIQPAVPVGATLGRYRLERELGAGGMGVVHAAFDPDLERRIALKVLRTGGGGDAEKRLLREARAMARLVHPNVVTVHEVGSANGRDYVAMELVEGETLAEWMRAERRPEVALIDAFVGAGRGLAAAHAAGIVHRDFKPHNVLRSRGGRIVVTDFGLARDAQDAPDPLAETRSAAPSALAAGHTPSSPLTGITVTGSLLGTPAYMAPEQWSGGAVTPATDQFAFCVALWEALAGERPFRGATVEALREEIHRGPAALDDSKITRRLRRVLRRGLDPVAANRWPSMDALITAVTRAERRPAVAIGIIAGALAMGLVIALLARPSSPSSPGTESSIAAITAACPPPALDPTTVWSEAARSKLVAANRTLEAQMLERDALMWRAARERACTGELAARPARLACLDAVQARFEVTVRAIESLAPEVPPADPGEYLIDPVVCEAQRLPRLSSLATPQLREVITASLREGATAGRVTHAAATTLVQRATADPCAAALARLLLAEAALQPGEREQQLSEAEQDADRCNDDRVRAEVATTVAHHALSGSYLGTAISSKVRLAEVAVERVAQRDLTADVDWLRLETAKRADNLEEAIARGEAAMAGYAARGRTARRIAAGIQVLDLRELRASPADLAAVPRLFAEWRSAAVAEVGEAHPTVRKLDAELAAHAFTHGDVEGGQARLDALRRPVPFEPARHIRGRVVDARGKPVEGATVVAGPFIAGSSRSISLPFPFLAGRLRHATTDRAGEFELPDGPDQGIVIAQSGTQRSRPVAIADRVALAVEPTSRLEGRVDLLGAPASRVMVAVQDLSLPTSMQYEVVAPVGADGSFSIDGLPRGPARLMAVLRNASTMSYASKDVEIRGPVVRGVEVAVARSKRVVHVVVRSTVGIPVGNAQVFTVPGTRTWTNALALNKDFGSANYKQARQIEGERAPPAVVGLARGGDLYATMSNTPEGVATACAVGLPGDLAERGLDRKVAMNLAKIEVRCRPIPPGAEAVVIEVPPWPRLD